MILRCHRTIVDGMRHDAYHSAALYGSHAQVDFLLPVSNRPNIILMHLEVSRTTNNE
ncbi:hypothetical protein U1Q18_038536, partial [Sarracenia purpurea var. burkii]